MRRQGRHAFRRLEYAYYLIALVIVGRGFFVLLLGTKAGGAPPFAWGGQVVTGLQVGVYLVAFALMVRFLPGISRTIARDPLLLLVQASVCLSLIWSVSRWHTLAALVPFCGASALGAVLATRLHGRQLVKLFAAALAIVMCASLVIVLALPAYGIASGGNAGAWQGAFEQKNMLGMRAALALVTFAFLLTSQGRWSRLGYLLLGIAATACLIGSTSKTSIVVAAVIVLIVPILRSLKWRLEIVAVTVSGAVLAMVVIVLALATQASALMPELNPRGTLQTRGELWRMVSEEILDRPVFGYGFGAFWQGGNGPDADILAVFGWGPQHAHNGFLNAALDVGLFGLGLFLVHLVVTLLRAGTRVRNGGPPSDLWFLCILVLLIGLNVTYSNLLGTSSFFWLLYVMVALAVRSPRLRRTAEIEALAGTRS